MDCEPYIHTWDSTISNDILEDMPTDVCLETCRQDYFGNEMSPGRRNSFQKTLLRTNKRLIKILI